MRFGDKTRPLKFERERPLGVSFLAFPPAGFHRHDILGLVTRPGWFLTERGAGSDPGVGKGSSVAVVCDRRAKFLEKFEGDEEF